MQITQTLKKIFNLSKQIFLKRDVIHAPSTWVNHLNLSKKGLYSIHNIRNKKQKLNCLAMNCTTITHKL